MWIPDPRFEMPELFEPGRKPVGPVEIDRDHWAGDACVKYIAALGQDVTHTTGSMVANAIDVPSDGTGGFDIDERLVNALSSAGFALSFVVHIKPRIDYLADYCYLARIGGAGSRSYISVDYAYYSNPRNFRLLARGYYGNTLQIDFTPALTSNDDANQERVLAGKVTSAGGILLDNIGNLSQASTSLTPYNASELLAGSNDIGGRNFLGGIYSVSFFAADFNEEQLLSLAHNPYQFLIPA